MPTVKKLPKWAIKQAGGINKKAWALARRGKGASRMKRSRARKPSKRRARRTPRRVSGASHGSHNNDKPGWGSYVKMGRTADIFTGTAQGAIGRHGFTREAGILAANRYMGGNDSSTVITPGENIGNLKPTVGAIGTGLVRDWFRSKLGVYRGIGRKKYLSIVMGANPELLAYSEASPLTDVRGWNRFRMMYDRAYDAENQVWSLSPGTAPGEAGRFWKSMGLDAGLKIFQKVSEKYLNPMLPKGHNL